MMMEANQKYEYSCKESLVSGWIENQDELTFTKLKDYTIQFESSISSETCKTIIRRLVALGLLIPQDDSRCPIYKPSKIAFHLRRLNKKRILNVLLVNNKEQGTKIEDLINVMTDKFCNLSSTYIHHLLEELMIDGLIAFNYESSAIFFIQSIGKIITTSTTASTTIV